MQFSVIIPTFNRPDVLRHCLLSLKDIDYPDGKWEIIVVNDGGSDPFSSTNAGLPDALPLTLLDIGHSGPGRARNKGVKAARGRYLAFIDDDCRVEPDWLRQFEKGFQSGLFDALGGRSLNPFPDNPGAAAWHYLIDFLYDFLKDEKGDALQIVSNNAAYRRSTFEALAGFDHTFPFAGGEDTELSYRLRAKGYRQLYFPDAKVWHYHIMPGIKAYVKQQFRYGRGYYHVKQALKKNQFKLSTIRMVNKTPYKRALIYSLLHSKAALPIWLLVLLSQIVVDPAGQYFESRSVDK